MKIPGTFEGGHSASFGPTKDVAFATDDYQIGPMPGAVAGVTGTADWVSRGGTMRPVFLPPAKDYAAVMTETQPFSKLDGTPVSGDSDADRSEF